MSPGPSLLAAAIQYRPLWGEVDHNRTRLLFLIHSAAKLGAELVVLPEMCTSGYIFPDRESILVHCEPRSGPTVQLFQREAARLGVTLCFGWPEIDPETDLLYNSAAVCFPDGETTFYRKRLLYDADESWSAPGDTPYPEWISKQGLKCTLGICMDLNDDGFIQHLKDKECRVVAFPTNWIDQGFKVWNYWAWRLDGTPSCLVAANRYGTEETTRFSGDSAILDGRTLLGWTEATGDNVVAAYIPLEPTPFQPDEDQE